MIPYTYFNQNNTYQFNNSHTIWSCVQNIVILHTIPIVSAREQRESGLFCLNHCFQALFQTIMKKHGYFGFNGFGNGFIVCLNETLAYAILTETYIRGQKNVP